MRKISNQIFEDSVLKEAVKIACEKEYDEQVLLAQKYPYEFSIDFVNQMNNLRKEQVKRTKRHKKKYWILIAAVLIFTTTTVLAVEPIQNKLYEVFVILFPIT